MTDPISERSPSAELRRLVSVPLRHPYLLILPILAGVAIAAVALWLAPRKYMSSTVILVESDAAPQGFGRDVDGERRTRRLATVKQEILSRTRIEKVLAELSPYPVRPGASMTPVIDRMRSHITISVRGNDAFGVDFVHTRPEMARDVANRLAGLFIEEFTRDREASTREAAGFIETELDKARIQLEQNEVELSAFKERHIGDLPEQLQANLAALQRLQLERQGIAEELSADLARLSILESTTRSSSRPLAVNASDPRGAQAAEMRSQLAALRTRYTEEHPDVRTLRTRLERLEKSMAEVAPTSGGGEAPLPRGGGGAMLREAQLRVRDLRARQADVERQLSSYQARVEQTPRTEEQLSTLTRDYEKLKERYLLLLNQKMGARMTVAVEERWKGDRFRVLDPAALPAAPFYPRPFVFLGLGLGGGLLLGLALCVSAEMLDQSVKTPAQLQAAISFPVLAIIPHVEEAVPSEERKTPSRAFPPLRPSAMEPDESPLPSEGTAELAAEQEPEPRSDEPEPAPAAASGAPPAALAAPPPAPEPRPATPAVALAQEAPATARDDDPYGLMLPASPRRKDKKRSAASALPSRPAGDDLWSAILETPPETELAKSEAAPPVHTKSTGPPVNGRGSRPQGDDAPASSSSSSGARASLLLTVDGAQRFIALPPAAEPYVFGSGSGCHVTVAAPQVEAIHARIESTELGLLASDAGTLSGTYVNGRRILTAQPLRPGDEVFLGSPGSRHSVRLVVSVDGTAPAPIASTTPVRGASELWRPPQPALSTHAKGSARRGTRGTPVVKPRSSGLRKLWRLLRGAQILLAALPSLLWA